MTTTPAIESAYAKAKGTWTNADWTHEAKVDGAYVTDDGDYTYCSGDVAGCDVCREATQNAEAAEALAAEAMDHARAGRWNEAADAMASAVLAEIEWGDTPTWGPLDVEISTHKEILAEQACGEKRSGLTSLGGTTDDD